MKAKAMIIAAAIVAAIPAVSLAATTITVDSVVQRWPWNNKVDITYTVGDGQVLPESGQRFLKIVFTTVINGVEYTIDGSKDVGASANTGKHTVTWTLPDGVKCPDCTMSAAVYESDAPSGDDYMVIDLTKSSDNVTWEGLLDSQDASNDRYTNNVYKTSKLVLRKVPAGGPYRTGSANSEYRTSNSVTNWTTTCDYYIGVFPITAYQYQKVNGSSPADNDNTRKPQNSVSWDALRRPSDYVGNFASTSAIPAVAVSGSGNFFQRLNYMTGNKFGFDLPTEIMYEIALRAGSTSDYYFWSDESTAPSDTSYIVYKGNSDNALTVVGSRKPNDWGFFDMGSNVTQWCLDDQVDENMATRPDVFTPAWAEGTNRRYRGGTFSTDFSGNNYKFFRASHRTGNASTNSSTTRGFRIAMIMR